MPTNCALPSIWRSADGKKDNSNTLKKQMNTTTNIGLPACCVQSGVAYRLITIHRESYGLHTKQ